LVNPAETEKEKRYFRLIETGILFDDADLKYIGTYMVYNGQIVLHLFECVGKEKNTLQKTERRKVCPKCGSKHTFIYRTMFAQCLDCKAWWQTIL